MSSVTERTFFAVKPDGVQRGLVGEIIGRFERRGFKLVALKMIRADRKLLEEHYVEHVDKPFFERLLYVMSSGPVVAMVWEGLKVVSTGRRLLGVTDPLDSSAGSIRGDFGMQPGRSVCHGSDSVESAKREIDLWFSPEETVSWVYKSCNWINE